MRPEPLVIHAADLHLGVPLDSLGRGLEPSRADHYRGLARKAFERMIEVTIEREAAALLLAGDVYDQADREVAAQLRFAAGLRRLNDAGVRVFIVHGNHDPLVERFHAAVSLPENATVFASGAPQTAGLDTAVGEWTVAGVSFGQTSEQENLAARFVSAIEVGAAARTIGLLHANLEGTTGHDRYAPCSAADLEAGPVAYWALGHIHTRTVAPLEGAGRWYAYPGNLQGRSTKPAECGPKGVLAVPLTAHGVGTPEFVACDRVRFERLDVDVSEASQSDDALELAALRVADACAAAGDLPLLLRVRLVGATRAHSQLRCVEAADLLGMLRERTSGLGDGSVLRVEVATRAAHDRVQLLERKDMVAELLARLDRLRGEPGSVPDLTRQAVDDASARSLVTEQLERDPTLAAELLDRAERILLDQLVGDDA